MAINVDSITNENETQRVASETRQRGSQQRRGTVDSSYRSITEMLRPVLGHRSLDPRADLILKWVKLSLSVSIDALKDYNVKVGSIGESKGYEVWYPGIIISINKKGSDRVSAHTLLIADDVPLESDTKPRINRGEDISVVPVPSLVWNTYYEKAVESEIVAMYGEATDGIPAIKNIKFASNGHTVVPHDLSIPAYGDNPSNDINPLDSLYINVVESLTSFDRFLAHDDYLVKLADGFDSRSQVISANVDQVPALEFDVMGQPRRSDFCISLSIKKKRNHDDNRADDSSPWNRGRNSDSGVILRVAGYVLPYFTEVNPDKRRPQNFGINIVLTDISGDATPSPELYIYGLAATSILTYNDMWVDGFKPSIIAATPNRNLGGLFIELLDKDGEPMERRTYSNTAVGEMMEDVDFLFSEDVKYSVDCAQSGPLTWITDMLVLNDYRTIFEAADNLTNNEFDRISSKNYSVIESSSTRRFYGGKAETENGTVDIREVDYLHQINYFSELDSKKAALDWDLSISDDSEIGLHERRRAMDAVYGPSGYTITNHFDRVVISSRFFTDLVNSLNAISMLPSFDSYSNNHRPKARLEAKDVAGVMSTRAISSMYNMGSRSDYTIRPNRNQYRQRD